MEDVQYEKKEMVTWTFVQEIYPIIKEMMIVTIRCSLKRDVHNWFVSLETFHMTIGSFLKDATNSDILIKLNDIKSILWSKDLEQYYAGRRNTYTNMLYSRAVNDACSKLKETQMFMFDKLNKEGIPFAPKADKNPSTAIGRSIGG